MKIIAIEKACDGNSDDQFKSLAVQEARKVWELQQNNFIRECYFTLDKDEAVLVIESACPDEAREILGTLPFVHAGLIWFELIPLRPYPGFGRLFRESRRDGFIQECSMTSQDIVFKALGHEKRLKILKWLNNPSAHFPQQKEGDLEKDGVCVLNIAGKLKVSQPTATQHLRILLDAKLVIPKRVGKWTFIRRNEDKIAELKEVAGSL